MTGDMAYVQGKGQKKPQLPGMCDIVFVHANPMNFRNQKATNEGMEAYLKMRRAKTGDGSGGDGEEDDDDNATIGLGMIMLIPLMSIVVLNWLGGMGFFRTTQER